MDFSAFVTDDKTSSAVVYKLEIIGESAKNYSRYDPRNVPASAMEANDGIV